MTTKLYVPFYTQPNIFYIPSLLCLLALTTPEEKGTQCLIHEKDRRKRWNDWRKGILYRPRGSRVISTALFSFYIHVGVSFIFESPVTVYCMDQRLFQFQRRFAPVRAVWEGLLPLLTHRLQQDRDAVKVKGTHVIG